jgi:hypothetical protein
MDESLRARMRQYVEDRCIPVPFAGCWIWMLSIASHGYGQASWPGARVTVAPRVSYEAFVGPIPPGMLVQHSCDSKWCVNPDHLSVGTDATNSLDKVRKGRQATREKIVKRLSVEAVLDIRLRARNGETQGSIADRYKVDLSTVSDVVLRKRYAKIPCAEPANDRQAEPKKESA